MGGCCVGREHEPYDPSSIGDIHLSRGNMVRLRVDKVVNNYTTEKVLGLGNYGEVWLAVNKRTGGKVAIKKIPMSSTDEKIISMVSNEIGILIKCVTLPLLTSAFRTTLTLLRFTRHLENQDALT